MQTLLINSPYKNNLYHEEFDNDIHAIMRLIDWNRGDPCVFRLSDYEELAQSDMMFARKFDSNIDTEIVKRISSLCS